MLSTRDIQVISIITYLMIGVGKMEIPMANSTAQIECKCTMYIVHYIYWKMKKPGKRRWEKLEKMRKRKKREERELWTHWGEQRAYTTEKTTQN